MVQPTLTLEDIIKQTADLPAAPATVLSVMKEADSPAGSAKTVADVLGQDPALAVKVLRLANSAYYGLSRQVMDIPDAVVVLGMRAVRNLCLLASSYSWMTKPLTGYGLGPKDLWRHSFATAVGSSMAAERSGACTPDQAFAAGLLHDLGKVVLNVWFEAKIGGMMELALQLDAPIEEVERRTLGFDHAEVGALLAEYWNLPKPLVAALRYHHEPSECAEQLPIIDCVHVADNLAAMLGLGLDRLKRNLDPKALKRLSIAPDEINPMCVELNAAYERQEKLFDGFQN